MQSNPTNRHGAAAIIVGAGIWGLFWLPLRTLDENGVRGLWAVLFVLLFSLIAATAAIILRGGIKWQDLGPSSRIGACIGASTVLYFVAVIYSDVIRVIMLFYLLPVWATLAARILYGELISRRRQAVIIIALAGMWLLLGGDGGLPVPRNIGDWCGIGAGILWGISLALIRNKSNVDAFVTAAMPFLFGAIIAFVFGAILAIVVPSPQTSFPTLTNLGAALPMAAIFGAMVLWPSMLSQVWGARLVPAPTAALLTMTEILVATISAYFIIGTDLSAQSLAGGVLIVIAAVIDLFSGSEILKTTIHQENDRNKR